MDAVKRTTESLPYRYELWKLDTGTLVHCRVSDTRRDPNAPDMIEGRLFVDYPHGYEWRVYRAHRELARFRAARTRCPYFP
jgi:hypothetical protein